MRSVVVLLFTVLLCAVEPITPIPQKVEYNQKMAKLGQKLFFDPILSRDYSVSCVSCHNVATNGADTKKVSYGVDDKAGSMNSPTVFNSVFNFVQFWNGRARDLKDQALGPVHNPVEMDLLPQKAAERLNQDPYYKESFKWIAKGKKITADDIAMVIAEYEKTLITPNSKFDRYLRGEYELSKEEASGYVLFKSLGCISCHNGVNVGGNSFQKMGVIFGYESYSGDDRFKETKRDRDRSVYKVPTLRNISKTAPYFHDGSSETLGEAIGKMSYHNLGLELTKEEIDLITIFLHTLDGEIPSMDLD